MFPLQAIVVAVKGAVASEGDRSDLAPAIAHSEKPAMATRIEVLLFMGFVPGNWARVRIVTATIGVRDGGPVQDQHRGFLGAGASAHRAFDHIGYAPLNSGN